MDRLALWIGYAVIYAGAILLAIAGLAALAGAVLEYCWRRYGDWKFLREFMEWRSGRIPG